jgi:GAF domain-containing protein
MTARCFDDFSAELGFDADQAILRVRGRVEEEVAPTLSGLLDLLIDQGHSDVVLDLAAVTFVSAAGRSVIASAAALIGTSGGVLTVHSAPNGIDDLVRTEAPDRQIATLGPEQRSGDQSAGTGSGSVGLSSDLARVQSIPRRREVIDAALRLVTVLACATVDGADGVSVSLERHGKVTTVASSNDTVLQMDHHQYETGQGPCVAAAAEGRWFHAESLAEERRWPAFTPLAMSQGIASILSTPLLVADRPLGALNIYSNRERAFGSPEQELAALFATQASVILADGGADVTDEQLTTRITDALLAREVIAQAQGVLMARHEMTTTDAAATLHRSARAAMLPVRRHAADVVASIGHNDDPDG